MFAQPIDLRLLLETEGPRERPAYVECNALPDQRPEDDVVGDEKQVKPSFLVSWVFCAGLWHAIGQENERREGVPNTRTDVFAQELKSPPRHEGKEE